MNALPILLAEDLELQVVMAGRDRCAYSYTAPRANVGWKEFSLEKLGEFEGRKRIHFTGLLTHKQYR